MNQLSGLIFGLLITIVISLSADLEEWNAFKLKYGKHYRNQSEERIRMEIFLQNKRKIEKHNEQHANKSVSFKMGVNKYCDLSKEEMNALMIGLRSPELLGSIHLENETVEYFVGSRHKHHHHHHHHHHRHHHYHHHHHHQHNRNLSNQHLPDSIDWSQEGAVNAGKLQKHCGSCWAFSTTGSIEGQYFRKHGILIRLSEQNLIDCVPDSYGCSGGYFLSGFRYAQDVGIDTDNGYPIPYIAEDGICQFNSSEAIKITGHKLILEGIENDLTEAIATVGPISVSIDAGHSSFHFYSSGIYYEPECSSDNLHHDVLAVGYGKNEDGEEYYIVKNWWGHQWGYNNGYFKLARNRGNHCGIATRAAYPTL